LDTPNELVLNTLKLLHIGYSARQNQWVVGCHLKMDSREFQCLNVGAS